MKQSNVDGVKVLLTRSAFGNEVLSRKLNDMGLCPLSFATIQFEPPEDWATVDRALSLLHSFDWVAFTSATGVRFFLERMEALHLNVPWRGRPHVAAVGRGTEQVLVSSGIRVDFVPSKYLTAKLASELPSNKGDKVLLLRAKVSDQTMSNILKERNIGVTEIAIYRTRMVSRGQIESLKSVDIVVFASPSSVESLCTNLTAEELDRLRSRLVVCIGPVTARAAEDWGFRRVRYPQTHTFDSLLDEIRRCVPLEG
jgi:uroporphyrinogen III methyltransferase/synthase